MPVQRQAHLRKSPRMPSGTPLVREKSKSRATLAFKNDVEIPIR